MPDHDALKPANDEVPVGSEIVGQLVQAAVIDRKRRVGVGPRARVGGKMLGRHGHPRGIGAGGIRGAQGAHRIGAGMKRAVTDDSGQSQVQVNHRREAQIDTQCTQFRGHEPAEGTCGSQRFVRVLVVEVSECPHGR